MKSLKRILVVLPLFGAALFGCSGGNDAPPLTKAEEKEVRNPTHVPPAGYKPVEGGGEAPGTNPSTTG